MAKWTELKIPCKPYTKKYVDITYGEFIKADHSTPFGTTVLLTLQKRLYETSRHKPASFIYDGMTSQVIVNVNNWQKKGLGRKFSQESIIVINNFLESQFIHELYSHCETYRQYAVDQTGNNFGIKEAIASFVKKFNLDLEGDYKSGVGFVGADITPDGLIKKYYRHRKKMEDQILRKKAFEENRSQQLRLL